MPTKEQVEAVVQKIGWLESMSYVREEGRVPETASDCFLPWWEELSRSEQQSVLAADVDWQGFSEPQKDDVIRRVIDGQEAGYWMDGIEPAGEKALFAEWREDYAAARRRDAIVDGPACCFEGETPVPDEAKTYSQQLDHAAVSAQCRQQDKDGPDR